MTLIEQLKQIRDPRYIRGLRHPLWMLLMLSLLGFLCGYRGYRPLADFCCQHESSLRDLLELAPTQAMPSYSTFRRTSLQVDLQGWVETFNAWSGSTLPSDIAALWSIDGKSIRSTSTGGNTSAQNFMSVVSVYEQRLGVLRLSLMENAKVSEIQVAQALIAQLPALPTGQCFSLDALHTTQTTVATIRAAQHHYLLAVKGNCAATQAALETIATTKSPQSEASEVDHSHGRVTRRHVQVFAPVLNSAPSG